MHKFKFTVDYDRGVASKRRWWGWLRRTALAGHHIDVIGDMVGYAKRVMLIADAQPFEGAVKMRVEHIPYVVQLTYNNFDTYKMGVDTIHLCHWGLRAIMPGFLKFLTAHNVVWLRLDPA